MSTQPLTGADPAPSTAAQVPLDKTSTAETPTTTFTASNAYRSYVLWLLFVVYGLSFVDRQILSTLMEPIRLEFKFNDTQLGMLSGLAFAIFYTTLGIPIARYADTHNRVTIISLSLLVWSAATALTGRAVGFFTLFLARVGVGIGEAGCNPSAYSIISDYYERQRRATVLSIYSQGVYLGQFLGYVAAGFVAQEYGWRTAFYVVGLPGIAMALLVKLTMREPPRGFSEVDYVPADPPPALHVLSKLLSKPAFVHLSFASGLHAMVAYGLNNFYSAYLMRSHGMTLTQTSTALALITLSGGLVGTYLGGKLSDVLGQRHGGDPRYQMWVPAVALLINIPVWLLALLLPWKLAVMLMMVPAIALGATYLGPSIATTHQLVGVRERGMGGALLLFVLNLIGIGLGPLATGKLSDVIRRKLVDSGVADNIALADGLKYALCIVAVVNLWSACHYFLAARTLRADIAKG